MVFFQAAFGGVHVPLAGCVMRVKTVFTRAAAREMLGCYGHAVLGHAIRLALDAGNQVAHNFADQGRVLTKGAVGALPARVGDRVGHVHVALAHAARIPFAPDGIGKLVNNINSAGTLDSGRNAQRAGPGGQNAERIVHAVHQFAVFIAGVGGCRHWDKVVAFLAHGIDLVDPVGQVGRGGVGAQNDMAVEIFFEHLGRAD